MMKKRGKPKKKDHLSLLATLAAGSNEPGKASPSREEKESSSPPEKSPKSDKKSKQKSPPSEQKKPAQKRKREEDGEDEQAAADISALVVAQAQDQLPSAQVGASAPSPFAAVAAASSVSLADQLEERQRQQLQLQQHQVERQRLLLNQMMMLENPAALNHVPNSFLSAGRNPMVPEEPDMATMLRRREQLLMQMQMNNQQSAQTEMMMRAAAAANVNPGAAGGLGSRAAFLMGNQTDLGAGMGSATISSALAAQRMGSFPSAAGLMGNMSGLMGNSTTMSGFPGQMPMGNIQNPASMVAAASASNFPPAAMGESSAMSSEAPAVESAAKRLAPARGVFNKNIKSNDEMIDSLARANARFYKNEAKKSGQQRFRGYQCEQWTQKYQELLDFRTEHGNCQVPHSYKKNIGLARWVKRQRYQYKLMIDGKQSTMTDERVKLLEDIGFCWDSHSAVWEERLNELREYRRVHGDCNVPSSYSANPKLATWIKCQRRQYKLLQEGRTSNMTLERMTELQRVGFSWRVQER